MTTHQNTQITRQRLLASLVLFTSGAIEGIYGRGNSLRARLGAMWSGILDSAELLAGEQVLHMEGEAPTEGEGEKQGLTVLGLSGITLAIVGCLVLAVCVLPICVLIVLTLLGPTIGNVFSDVIENIETAP